jgi:hypothetical protein
MPNSPKTKRDVEIERHEMQRAWFWRVVFALIVVLWGGLIYVAVSN